VVEPAAEGVEEIVAALQRVEHRGEVAHVGVAGGGEAIHPGVPRDRVIDA
jgi:hypothetical protein